MARLFDDVVAALSERPRVALALLILGVVFGVGMRGVASDDAPPPAEPTAAVQDEQTREPESQPEPENDERPEKQKPEVEPGSDGAASAIDDYQASLGGAALVGAVILPFSGDDGAVGGDLESGPPWSVMKVPAAAAYLNFKRETEGTSSGEAALDDTSDLEAALIQSDNLGIRRPVQEMIDEESPEDAAARINGMLDEGEASSIRISSAIDPSIQSLQLGTGEWRLDEAAEWFRQLQAGATCLGISGQDRAFILSLLEQAPTALNWGAAPVLGADDFALKPGWGASDVYTTEQLVIVGNGDGPDFPSSQNGYVMAIMAQVPGTTESSFEEGKDHLKEMATLISESMGTPSGSIEDFSATC